MVVLCVVKMKATVETLVNMKAMIIKEATDKGESDRDDEHRDR